MRMGRKNNSPKDISFCFNKKKHGTILLSWITYLLPLLAILHFPNLGNVPPSLEAVNQITLAPDTRVGMCPVLAHERSTMELKCQLGSFNCVLIQILGKTKTNKPKNPKNVSTMLLSRNDLNFSYLKPVVSFYTIHKKYSMCKRRK